MWRRVTLAAVLAGVAVVGFLLLLLRSETGGQHLCEVAQASLRDVFRARVVIGHCHVDPLTTHVVIEDVEIGEHDHPLLSAEKISAGVDTKSLLAGRVRVDGVEVLRPRVDADLSHPSPDSEVRPRRPKAAACLPDLGPIEIAHVAVREGDFTMRLPGGRTLTSAGLDFELTGKGSLLDVALKAARTSLTGVGGDAVVERAGLQGSVDLAAGTAKVRALDVSAPEGSLFAQADLFNVCAPRGNATVTLHADLGRLGKSVLRDVENLAGEVTVRAQASIDGELWDTTADVQAKDSSFDRYAPGTFTARVHATPKRLEIHRFDLTLPSGKGRASGTLQLEEPYVVNAEASFEDASMGDFLERVGVHDVTVEAVGTGTARVQGPLTGPRGMQLTGSADVKVSEYGVYDRSWKRRHEKGAQIYSQLVHGGTLKTSYVIEQDRLLLKTGHIEGRDGSVADVRGVITYSMREGMAIEFDAPALNLAEIGPFGPANCFGHGWAAGSVMGPYKALDIQAHGGVRELKVMGYDIGQVSASGRMQLDRMTIDVPEAHGTRGRSSWHGHGGMDLSGKVMTVYAATQLNSVHAIDLADVSREVFPVMGVLDGKFDALVTGPVEMTGDIRRPDIATNVQLADVEVWGQHFEMGEMIANLVHGDRVEIDKLRLERGGGRISAKGWYDVPGDSFELKAASHKLHVRDLDHLAGAMPELTGGVTASIVAKGTLDHPEASGTLTLRNLFLGEQPLATARLGWTLDGSQLAVDGSLASPWPKGAKHPAHKDGEPYAVPPGSMFHEVHAHVGLTGDMPYDVETLLEVPTIKPLLKPGQLEGVDAGFAGSFTARGVLARPLESEATLQLDRLWARKDKLEVENAEPAVLRLSGGTLSLDSLPLRGPSFQLDASGTRSLTGELDVNVTGSADLGPLRTLVPDLEELKGHMELAVNLTGNEKSPVMVGNASMDGVALRARDLPVGLTDGHGVVTFSPEMVVVEGLEGKLNDGPVSVSGQLELEHFKPGHFELRTELGDMTLRFDDLPITVAGSTEVSGTLDQMTLSGDLEIVRFHFTRDLELERTIINALELARRPPAPKVFERAGEFLTLDLGVHLGDVRVDNNLLKAELKGDLRATGTNRRPGLLGAVTIAEGKALVRNTEFALSSGVINFTDRNRIRPAFDVRADAQVRDYLVHVTASGTPQQPRLVLSSEPALSEADIVTLLTLGVTSRDFDRTGGASLTGFLLDAAYNASGLSDQVKRLLPKNEILKDSSFRVTSAYNELSGNIEPIAQLEATVLRENLKLRGQTSLLTGRNRKAQLEWRLNENRDLQLQWDGDNPSAPSFGDVGGDYRLHWEAP